MHSWGTEADATPATETLEPDSRPTEPVLVQDVTGSFRDPASPTPGAPSKRYVATQLARVLVERLSGADSAALDESGDKGGLRTYWFADGRADELGDLRPDNFDRLWNTLSWEGGTYIMPALRKVEAGYREEFANKPAEIQPLLKLVVVTDGALSDLGAATHWLSSVADSIYVIVVVLGYGDAHDQAVREWQQLAATHTHVRVVVAQSATDGAAIASELLAMGL